MMTGKGELTDLLLAQPVDPNKVLSYAVTKKLNPNNLFELSTAVSKMTKTVVNKMSLICLAAYKCKPNVIEILLQEGWQVNGTVNDTEPPLWTALVGGNIPVAKLLIQKGADLNYYSHGHGTTLMTAALTKDKARTGKDEIACVEGAELLINAGVSVNAIIHRENQERAIHKAAYNGHPNVLKFLIQKGADVNAKDKSGFTALHICSISNHIKCIKVLMKNNRVDIYVQNKCGYTALQIAVRNNSKQAVKTLVKEGFNVNHSSNIITPSALILAVALLNLEMVSILLDLGADPNLQLSIYISPLFVVASQDQESAIHPKPENKKSLRLRKDIAQLLIERGGNINTDNVTSPLDRAICEGFYGLAKLFVRLGANVNIRHISHCTLFHQVVGRNCDLIQLFLEYGGDYNSFDKVKETPYNVAIYRGVDLKFIKCFIQFGCPYDQNLNMPKTLPKNVSWEINCFFLAEHKFFEGIKKNDLDLVIAAVKEGAVVNGCSEEITYPIHFLAFRGYNEILHFLLEKGALPNMLNKQGESALYIAAKHGHYDCCCTLLKFGACYNYSYRVEEIQNKHVIKLLQNVRNMFALTCVGHKKVISKLENLMNKDINKYLIYAKATNCRGDSLLATAVRKNHTSIAQVLIKLSTRCNL